MFDFFRQKKPVSMRKQDWEELGSMIELFGTVLQERLQGHDKAILDLAKDIDTLRKEVADLRAHALEEAYARAMERAYPHLKGETQ